MLIAMGTPPIPFTTLMMDFESQKGIVEFGIKVTEKRTTYINKRTNPCKYYDQNGKSFSQCVKEFLSDKFETPMKCFLPGKH